MGTHRQGRCPISHHVKMRKENTSLNWWYSLGWLTWWANLTRPWFPLFDQGPVFNSGLHATCWRKALKLSSESCLSCPYVSLPPCLPLDFRHDYPKSACVDCILWLTHFSLKPLSFCFLLLFVHIYTVCAFYVMGIIMCYFLHITYTIGLFFFGGTWTI